jgi:hypothetical protein
MRTWRLKADTRVNETFLTDYRTGERLFLVRGDDVALELGLFENGELVSNADVVTATITTATQTLETTPTSQSEAAITLAEWQGDTDQHATVNFTDTVTGGLTVTAGYKLLQVVVSHDDGSVVTYAQGLVEFK